jgi:hypothetical protein
MQYGVDIPSGTVKHSQEWHPEVLKGGMTSLRSDSVQYRMQSGTRAVGDILAFFIYFLLPSALAAQRWFRVIFCTGVFTVRRRLTSIILCRSTPGVKSFQLDDDNCYCHTTLDMGASMCGAGGDANKGTCPRPPL